MREDTFISEDQEKEELQPSSESSYLTAFGEMTLKEVFKKLWQKCLNLKLKYVLYSLLFILALGGFVFIVYELGNLIVGVIKEPLYVLVKGEYSSHTSNPFYRLLLSLPVSILVSWIVGGSFQKRKFLWGLVYLIILQGILFLWNSWDVYEIGISTAYGGICFVVLYIFMPALFYLLHRQNE